MHQNYSDNNKRIAKNTMLLYIRMLFMMLVSLYTSRVILNGLGVEDFGIYNVVGGVVALFAVISGSLSAAISRFITFELGKKDQTKLNRIFSTSVSIQIILSILIVFLIEFIGVWFLNNKMTIPTQRLGAANWVLQFSIVTFVINLISIPYNAAIIAHEKMTAFAYIGILEAVGKLAIAFLITHVFIDKLVFYSILMCAVAIVVRAVYGYYCKKHFVECTYNFCWDKDVFNKMFKFAVWNFIGAASSVIGGQGINILINVFFGPAVNAARGISIQVNGAVIGFVNNFLTAVNPQITKAYAVGNKEYMMNLIYQASRLSFYMLLLLSLPVIFNAHYILDIWLKVVPIHTVAFVQLILIFAMCESISYPLITAMLATGNIKKYQIIDGCLQLINVPICYLLFRFGYIPEYATIVPIITSQFCLFYRLFSLEKMIGISLKIFLKDVYLNIILVSFVSILIPLVIDGLLNETFCSFVVKSIVSVLSTSLAILYIGCNKKERSFLKNKIHIIIAKILRKNH